MHRIHRRNWPAGPTSLIPPFDLFDLVGMSSEEGPQQTAVYQREVFYMACMACLPSG